MTHSEWAAPIVVVPKKDGRFRLCGDYKVTVNPVLDVDQYPLPKPDDLFASLAGGERFTKLDLSQAYMQLLLDEESAPYLTVNTHRGLYEYTRLPFGVALAPALFQKVMDTLLQGIPNVLCYIDDILVTGNSEAAHLRNLEEVLKRLHKEGFRLKRSKCAFMKKSVEYLGHTIIAEGLHPTSAKLEAITHAPPPQQVSSALIPFQHRQEELTVEGECLLWGIRVIVPTKLRAQVLEELHRDHQGMSRMKAVARSHLWWPGLDQQIEELVRSCERCLAGKPAPAAAPLHPWVWPTRPWTRVHIDFAGPFEDKMFLLAVDAHSKWPEVVVMANTSSSNTINALRRMFASYGIPERIVSDNGPQFTSTEFADFLHGNGVKHTRSAPYHPASNGAVERLVQTFKNAMWASRGDARSLQHRLDSFLFSYRTSPHATTGQAPCSLFLGRSLRTRFDLLKPDVEGRVLNKQSSQVSQHDQHSKARTLVVGQKVMARDFRTRHGPAWVPGIVQTVLGPVSYMVKVAEGLTWKRHVDHIRARGDLTADPELTGCPEVIFPEESPPIGTSPDVEDQDGLTSGPDVGPPESRYPQRVRRAPDRFT